MSIDISRSDSTLLLTDDNGKQYVGRPANLIISRMSGGARISFRFGTDSEYKDFLNVLITDMSIDSLAAINWNDFVSKIATLINDFD